MSRSSTLIAALGRAIEGQRVWLVATSMREARDYFADAMRVLPVATYRSTNGAESITFPSGGIIRFQSPRSNGRGAIADRVYVPSTIPDHVLAAIIPSLESSSDGAIVSYETEAAAGRGS